MDNLESKLNTSWTAAPRYYTDETRIQPEEKKAEKKKPGFFQKAKNKIATGIALGWMALVGAGCSSPTTPPPPQNYTHAITIKQPVFMENGMQAAGSFTVVYNGSNYTGNFGQTLTLPTTTSKEIVCQVTLNTTGKPRTYNQGAIGQDTKLAPSVMMPDFPAAEYIQYVSPTGKNVGWGARNITVYFNPDPTTGLRLDQAYINAIKEKINSDMAQQDFQHWSIVFPWGQYFIQNVTYVDNGTKPYDATVPPDGDIWVYRVSDYSGGSHIQYPISGTYVMSGKIMINEDSSSLGTAETETQLLFFKNVTGIGGYPQLSEWANLTANRPFTIDYTLALTGEYQDAFDVKSTDSPTTQLSDAEGEMYNSSSFNLIYLPGKNSNHSAGTAGTASPLDKRIRESQREKH